VRIGKGSEHRWGRGSGEGFHYAERERGYAHGGNEAIRSEVKERSEIRGLPSGENKENGGVVAWGRKRKGNEGTCHGKREEERGKERKERKKRIERKREK
jgi:hypothetical protein